MVFPSSPRMSQRDAPTLRSLLVSRIHIITIPLRDIDILQPVAPASLTSPKAASSVSSSATQSSAT